MKYGHLFDLLIFILEKYWTNSNSHFVKLGTTHTVCVMKKQDK